MQKTNSVISPYIGTLKAYVRYTTYSRNKNKTIAEQEIRIDGKSSAYSYLFTIAYQDGSWNVTSVQRDGEQINADSIVNILSCRDEIRK